MRPVARKLSLAAILIAVTNPLVGTACAAESRPEKEAGQVKERFNVPIPTFGGKQIWVDVHIYGGWRVQQNVFTERYRLLDPRDIRRAWGSLELCERKLEEAKQRGEATLRSDKVCVLLHGYLRSKDSMRKMKRALKAAGYEVYAVNYPSTRFTMETFVDQVTHLLNDIQGDFKEISLVTHSMGGIVARRVLSQHEFKNIGRLVMMAPPNQGSIVADMLLEWWPKERVTGPAWKQLATDVEGFARNAGVPECEFGIIAGERTEGKGWNPLVPGSDDGLISVENTRMERMTDFVTVRTIHSRIMKNDDAIRHTVHFLKQGAFDHGIDGDSE